MAAMAGTFGGLTLWSYNDMAETLWVGAGVTYLGSSEKAREAGGLPRDASGGMARTQKRYVL